jgi:hypothetical protein
MTRTNLPRLLPLGVAFLVLVVTGLVHGLWTGRWHTSHDLELAAESVHDVPLAVGDWEGKAEESDAESFQQAGAAGYWTRRYRFGDEQVTVILMCGRPGRLSVHTPNDCYRGAGYEMVERAPVRQTVRSGKGGEAGEFWTARFQKADGATASQIRIYWAWKAAGSWQAPDQPRWVFRGNDFLYKLYVIREAADDDVGPTADPAQTFLSQMLPALRQSLFSPPAP